MTHIATISAELGLAAGQIEAVAGLLDQGGTVPFIARYRKEATGSLDEVAVTAIRDRLHRLAELDERKAAVLKSLEATGHLTTELQERVSAAPTLAVLEDLYLPFRPKRRTKATVAREKGLEPLARDLLEQTGSEPEQLAAGFVDPQNGVESIAAALEGARHIIAETVNEDPRARERLRDLYWSKGVIRSKVATDKEAEGAKYRNYFDWSEPAAKAPSHRILAMRRGEKEDILNLAMGPPEDVAVALLEDLFVQGDGPDTAQVRLAVNDGYRRLLSRAMETELRLATKQRADQQAIRIFAGNLRQLLLSPPLGARRVMGIDPGFRTGCKLVCLDRQGKLLHHETVYPHLTERQDRQAAEKIAELCQRYTIEAVAVGNGTAGRETEAFVRQIEALKAIPVIMVNESGASIYSASEAARREFADLDLTVRGSVSIARRLMDPLSELVKIDPKSIGVGQYQHDVDQGDLKQALDDVVTSCVNAVGVDVNRASVELLTYVAGLGPQLAANIVAVRNEKGPFTARTELLGVPRLGPKAFEQSAGFLRIHAGANPLDASAVHPERYAVVDAMARDQGCDVAELMRNAQRRKNIDLTRYVGDTIGLPTLRDILAELDKPGRDPRQDFETVTFAGHVNQIGDLRAGMTLPGVVTNVTAFGAFVDIGVHQDGLVHISEMADAFVKDPSDVVAVQQRVRVTVLDVDLERSRIALSMKSAPEPKAVATEKPDRPRPPKREKRKPVPEKKASRPFHNPFADALGRDKRR
ncbi:MAG: Tex family protein [Desulfobacterales bacterium]